MGHWARDYGSNFDDNPIFLQNLRINCPEKSEKKSTKDSSKKFFYNNSEILPNYF